MISTGPIEDRLAIRELVESYNDAVMRIDSEAWGANWLEDSTWIVRGEVISGRARIIDEWMKRMSPVTFIEFFSSAGPIVVTGRQARATWHQKERMYTDSGMKREASGRYEDQYVKVDGRWYFKTRDFNVLEIRQIE